MLGNAGQKIQRMVDLAEDLYERVNQLREQIAELRETVEDTNERVASVETDVADQRALLEALAEEQGIDVDEFVGGEEDPDVVEDAAGSPDEAPSSGDGPPVADGE